MADYGTTDRCTGGTASASSIFSASYVAAYGFDDNANTDWLSQNAAGYPQWLKYDFGAAVKWRIGQVKIKASVIQYGYAPKTWTIDGSNDDSNWTTANTQTDVAAWTAGLERTYSFSNNIAYRYVRINITVSQTSYYTGFAEMQMFEDIRPVPSGFFLFLCEAFERNKKLWQPKLLLPKEEYSY